MKTDWTKFKKKTDWSTYRKRPEIKSEEKSTDFWGGATTFVKGLLKLPKTIAASVLQSTQGKKGASVVDRGWADKFIERTAQDINKFSLETQEKYGEAKPLPGMPFKITDIAQLPQNLAYSITSMGAGLGAGLGTLATTKLPPLAWTAGTAASGAVAYSATTYQVMQQYLEMKNQEKLSKTGKPLDKREEDYLKDYFDKEASKYGLWEAIPEAISNVAFGGAFTKPFTSALAKVVGKSTALQMTARLGGIIGQELATETITQKGQAPIEARAGMREKDVSWGEAFKEIAPQTFLLSTILAGAGSAIIPIQKAKEKVQASLKNEIGNTPQYEEIKQQVEDGFNQLESKEVPSDPLTQEVVKAQPTYYHGTGEEFDVPKSMRQLRKEGSDIEPSNISGNSPFFHLSEEPRQAKGYAINRMINIRGLPVVKEFKIEGKLLDLTKHPSEYSSKEKEILFKIGNDLIEKSGNRGGDASIGGELIYLGKPRKNYTEIRNANLSFNDIESSQYFINKLEEFGYSGFKFKDRTTVGGYVDSIAAIPEKVKTKSQLTWNKAQGSMPSGIAKGFAKKAEKVGITDLPSLATYEASTIKEQERLMKNFFDNGGIEIAGDILDQTKPLPQGIKAINFLDETEKYIKQNPTNPRNIQLLKKLISSPLNTVGSEAGSTLGLSQKRDGNSFTQRAQRVNKSLKEKKTGINKNDIITETKKKNLSKAELETKLSNFIDKITC